MKIRSIDTYITLLWKPHYFKLSLKFRVVEISMLRDSQFIIYDSKKTGIFLNIFQFSHNFLDSVIQFFFDGLNIRK